MNNAAHTSNILGSTTTAMDIANAYGALHRALTSQKLPDGQGGERRAKSEEFMLMTLETKGGKKVSAFKHGDTRNYLWLIAGKVRLGDGVSPFQLHDFHTI